VVYRFTVKTIAGKCCRQTISRFKKLLTERRGSGCGANQFPGGSFHPLESSALHGALLQQLRIKRGSLLNPTGSDTGDTMMLSLYVALGIFLLIAVRNPSAHRSLIAFAAWSSYAHAVAMSILGLEIAS
jgi:hypothetical protein